MPRFRRRRFGGFSRKGTREQLLWFRQVVTNTDAAAFGVPLTNTIFNPTTFQAGNIDEQWTIRRVKLQAYTRDTFSAATAQILQHFAGVAIVGVGETPSPALRTAGDQDTDWMALGEGGLTIVGGASNVQQSPAVSPNPQSGFNPWAFDIRAQRKIDMDERLVYQVDDLANGTDGNPTRSARICTVFVSVLFQRTRR